MQRHTNQVSLDRGEVRKRFVSWVNGEADREWTCLSLLDTHAPGVAPRPLRREQDGDAPVVVMERVQGKPLPLRPATHAQINALGRALQRVYAVPIASIDAAGLPERRFGPTTIAGSLQAALDKPRDLLGCDDPSLVRHALDRIAAHIASPGAIPIPQLTVMGIADLNPANVLWDGEVCRLVDFEDGGVTDPAFELADHVEHIAARLAAVYHVEQLLSATGLPTEHRERFDAYRVLWAAFWLLMLLPGNSAHTRNPRGTTEAQANHLLELLCTMRHAR